MAAPAEHGSVLKLEPKAEGIETAGAAAAKVPKSVQIARDALGKLTRSADDLKKVPPGTLNTLQTTLRKSMSTQDKDKWSTLAPDERREWIAQFITDPSACRRSGYTTTKAVDSRMSEDGEEWVLQSTLAGPLWLNDKETAHILCDSGDLESRPSTYPSLAQKGMKEFK
eukprot:4839547-Pyramimonas_sp.AAC.1